MKLVHLLIALCIVLLIGCSSDVTTIQTHRPSYANSYFPAYPGYEISYQEITYTGSKTTYSIEVGDTVSIDGQDALEWKLSRSNGAVELSYVVVTGAFVAHYEDGNSLPEIILNLPLQYGRSWDRYGTISTGGLGFEDLNGDGLPDVVDTTSGGGGGGDNGGGGDLFQTTPVSGGNVMTVEAVETITLHDGRTVTGAVRVRNDAVGSNNYYWYAIGQGIVKYSLGAQATNPQAGTVIGEKTN